MKTNEENHHLWLLIRIGEPSQPTQSQFVRVGDIHKHEALQKRHAKQNLHVSNCFYDDNRIDAGRIYWLYFWICGKSLEETRVSALEIMFYIAEHFYIPEDQIEFIYDGETNIILIVYPNIFAGLPTPLMPAINYSLARQMVEDGLTNIDVDYYIRG